MPLLRAVEVAPKYVGSMCDLLGMSSDPVHVYVGIRQAQHSVILVQCWQW